MKAINTGVSTGFFFNNEWVSATSDHVNYQRIESLVLEDKYEEAAKLVSMKEVVLAATLGSNLELVGNQIEYKGYVVRGVLGERILQLAKNGQPVSYLEKFLDNLMDNPSDRAVTELYGFIEESKLPITDDGHFLAYKSIREDWTDHHSGTMDNSIGAVVEMPRNQVDEDKDRTCSRGLHFAAHEYARGFGYRSSRMVLVKINPKDVVSIPSDYNNQKGRACKYTIYKEVDRDDGSIIDSGAVNTGTKDEPKYKPKYSVGQRLRGTVTGTIYEITAVDGEKYELFDHDVELTGFAFVEYLDDSALHVPVHTVDWDDDLWLVDTLFTGDNCEFPTNVDNRYRIVRTDPYKEYVGNYRFVKYDDTHDNLVFRTVVDVVDGEEQYKYLTVDDMKYWTVEKQ